MDDHIIQKFKLLAKVIAAEFTRLNLLDGGVFASLAKSKLFQKTLREGGVFVVPRGLLHYRLISSFELATFFQVLSNQNSGVVSILEAMFVPIDSNTKVLMKKLTSLSTRGKSRSRV